MHGAGPIRSLMIAPGAGPQKVRRDTLGRGDSIAYPAGWVHYQLNDGCTNATALLVWNAVHSGGVNNVPQQLGALPDDGEDYKGALFPRGKGPRQGFWLRDAECSRRCGLDLTEKGVEVGSAAEAEAEAADGDGRRRAMDAALVA